MKPSEAVAKEQKSQTLLHTIDLPAFQTSLSEGRDAAVFISDSPTPGTLTGHRKKKGARMNMKMPTTKNGSHLYTSYKAL